MHRVAILVGPESAGTNMRALVSAMRCGEIVAEPFVFAHSPNAPAAKIAETLAAPVIIVDPIADDQNTLLLQALKDNSIDVVCLAGYLRLIAKPVLDAFPDRIINIHPSLLPKFGGKGLYGSKVHDAVLKAGETESGCTVHFVSERYDEGEIILQLKCEVLPNDTNISLGQRVLSLEHQAYPAALKRVLANV